MGIPRAGLKDLLHAVPELFPGAVIDIRLEAPDRICCPALSGTGCLLFTLEQNRSQNAGRLVVPLSGPVADSRDVRIFRNLISCLYGGKKCGSRRRHALSLPVLMDMQPKVPALCDIEDRRDRDRKNSVLAADHARPLRERRHGGRIHVKAVHEHRAGNDIDDGIDRADLMKMNLIQGQAVGLRLRLRENPEDLLGKRSRRVSHVRLRKNPPNIRVAPVLMVGVMAGIMTVTVMVMLLNTSIEIGHVVVVVFMRLVKDHIEVKAGYARLLHARNLRPEARKRKAGDRPLKSRAVRSQIEQGRGRHVPADTGCALKI